LRKAGQGRPGERYLRPIAPPGLAYEDPEEDARYEHDADQ
jgi:hypothetical protein